MVEDKFVEINGLNLHYLDWGNEATPFGMAISTGSRQAQDRPVMLLVHGMTGNCHDWDGFAVRIHENYHVLALDQPGHGDSDWSKETA